MNEDHLLDSLRYMLEQRELKKHKEAKLRLRDAEKWEKMFKQFEQFKWQGHTNLADTDEEQTRLAEEYDGKTSNTHRKRRNRT